MKTACERSEKAEDAIWLVIEVPGATRRIGQASRSQSPEAAKVIKADLRSMSRYG